MAHPSRYGAADRTRLSQFYPLVVATFVIVLGVGGSFVVLAFRSGAMPF